MYWRLLYFTQLTKWLKICHFYFVSLYSRYKVPGRSYFLCLSRGTWGAMSGSRDKSLMKWEIGSAVPKRKACGPLATRTHPPMVLEELSSKQSLHIMICGHIYDALQLVWKYTEGLSERCRDPRCSGLAVWLLVCSLFPSSTPLSGFFGLEVRIILPHLWTPSRDSQSRHPSE